MNNTEKKLDALIDALGFDVEEVERGSVMVSKDEGERMIRANSATASYSLISDRGEYRRGDDDCYFSVAGVTTDYKLTKRKFNSKPTLHKIIREYENEGMSASEMIGRIMLMEGVTNEDL